MCCARSSPERPKPSYGSKTLLAVSSHVARTCAGSMKQRRSVNMKDAVAVVVVKEEVAERPSHRER
jgi:hypothetical protein